MAAITRYVFWDFGDTLVGLDHNIIQRFVEIIFQRCGCRVSVTDLCEAMRNEWDFRGQPDQWDKIKKVETSDMEHEYYSDFFKGTLLRLGIEDCIQSDELSKELATLKVTPASYVDFSDALEIVDRLSKLGVKQAIISNGFHTAPKILMQSKLRDKFEFEIWSYKHGTIKPEKEIYKLALDRAGCRPEEVIFVDDREKFVEAAQKLNIRAIQINRSQSRNTEQGDQKSFPIINNLAAVEKYIHFEESTKRSIKDDVGTREASNLRIAIV